MNDSNTHKRLVSGTWVVIKLGVAGAVIAAIAFSFVTFDNPRGEVAEAEADIWDIFSQETSKHEAFMKTLEEEGMAPPRRYDHNGNQVFFSYDTTRESPRQVMHRYQDAFVRNDVNLMAHHTVREPIAPDQVDDADTMLQGSAGLNEVFMGGLIPIELTRNRMAMVGIETKEGARDMEDLLLETELGRVSPEEFVGGIRYVDAFREQGSLETTVTAVWSDEHLDLSKFRSDSRAEGTVHPIEMEIPSCMRCTRVSRFSGTEHEEGFHSILYRSEQQSIHELVDFYDLHMERYGWQPDPSMHGFNALQAQALAPNDRDSEIRAFVKDGLHLTLMIYYDEQDGNNYVKIQTNS